MESGDNSSDEDDNEEFYFESDHLALRGNADYSAVLRTIAILQAQKIQATKDIDRIATLEREALSDPEEFLRKVSSGVDLDIPGPINIAELPKVHFDKYNVFFPDFVEDTSKNNSQDITVRGRIFDQTKPETFNQLWTCDEQRRLEDLLIEYPPEPVEMRRFAKIARALGNRTTKQVASRVQKYFKKLHSAGMPVPGRLPKSTKPCLTKSLKLSKLGLRPSTFFPAQDVPFTMPEDDDIESERYFMGPSTRSERDRFTFDETAPTFAVIDPGSDDDENPDDESDHQAKLLKIISRVRRDKLEDTSTVRTHSEHTNFSCDFCTETPIRGTRWHCRTCKDKSIDYCSDCFIRQATSSQPHSLFHIFDGIRTIETRNDKRSFVCPLDADLEDSPDEDCKMNLKLNIHDKDYMPAKFSTHKDYNYLDPNFLP